MKKIIYLLLIATVICSLIGCTILSRDSNTNKYIKRKINVDISDCNIIVDNYKKGFFGDGDYFVKANCSNNSENMIKQLSSWKQLPLSENLQLIMYGGKKGNVYYSYDFAKKAGIPEIKNGLYFFIDRHDESKDKYSDKYLFTRSSHNFTIAMYDLDSNILYYYEDDS